MAVIWPLHIICMSSVPRCRRRARTGAQGRGAASAGTDRSTGGSAALVKENGGARHRQVWVEETPEVLKCIRPPPNTASQSPTSLMPINLLDHVIARRHVHDDLNVADSLERFAARARARAANTGTWLGVSAYSAAWACWVGALAACSGPSVVIEFRCTYCCISSGLGITTVSTPSFE